MVDDGSTDGTAATARAAAGPPPPPPGDQPPGQPGEGGGRAHRGGPGPRRRYTAYMDADMAIDPRAIPLLLDGLGTNDAGHRLAGPGRLDGGRHLHDAVAHGPAVQPPGDHRHRARAAGHPVRVQGLPDPGRPPAVPPGADRPVRLRRRGPGPGPPPRPPRSPRCPSSGSTSPAAPSTRSTTRSPCWPTSTGPGSACWRRPRCPAVVVRARSARAREPCPVDRIAAVVAAAGGAPVPVVPRCRAIGRHRRPVGDRAAAPGRAGRGGHGARRPAGRVRPPRRLASGHDRRRPVRARAAVGPAEAGAGPDRDRRIPPAVPWPG